MGLQCLGAGHFIYECKSTRPYVSRPSRTQQLAKTSTLDKAKLEGKPSVDLPDEFKTKCASEPLTNLLHVLIVIATTRTGTANKLLEAKEKERAKDKPGESSTNVKSGKRRRRHALFFHRGMLEINYSRPFFSVYPRHPIQNWIPTLTLTRDQTQILLPGPTQIRRLGPRVHVQDLGLARLPTRRDAERAFPRQIVVIVVAEARPDEDVTRAKNFLAMSGGNGRHNATQLDIATNVDHPHFFSQLRLDQSLAKLVIHN